MKKNLFLGLFLVIATIVTSYGQSTVMVDPAVATTTNVTAGDTVEFENTTVLNLIETGLLDVQATTYITCTSAPTGVNSADFSQTKVVAAGLTTILDLVDVVLNNPITGPAAQATLIPLLDALDLDELLGFDDYTFTTPGTYTFEHGGLLENVINFTNEVAPDGTLSVKNVENTPEFSVFSQDGIVTVNNTNDSAVTGIAVYSISGAQMFASNRAVASIDLSAVANGVYILTVQEGASITTKKFIKS